MKTAEKKERERNSANTTNIVISMWDKLRTQSLLGLIHNTIKMQNSEKKVAISKAPLMLNHML